jgi:uncharacterized membrane protein YhdT
MPAPARKRSASLAKPASESYPILSITLGLIATFILVAMVFHNKADQTMFPQWIETKFNLQISSTSLPIIIPVEFSVPQWR